MLNEEKCYLVKYKISSISSLLHRCFGGLGRCKNYFWACEWGVQIGQWPSTTVIGKKVLCWPKIISGLLTYPHDLASIALLQKSSMRRQNSQYLLGFASTAGSGSEADCKEVSKVKMTVKELWKKGEHPGSALFEKSNQWNHNWRLLRMWIQNQPVE